MTVVFARLLRWLVTPSRTHLRADTGREGRGYVDTRCGLRVHHARAAAPFGAVAVLIQNTRPVEWSRLRVETWVTCPTCRHTEGWPTP